MAINFDFALRFYKDILLSHHGTDAVWIDENSIETPIRLFINRESFEGRSKNYKNSIYNTRNIEVWIANHAVYGRTNIKPKIEKLKFKRDVTDSNDQTFLVDNLVKSDKRKIILALT